MMGFSRFLLSESGFTVLQDLQDFLVGIAILRMMGFTVFLGILLCGCFDVT
jgi:hypothetical protein